MNYNPASSYKVANVETTDQGKLILIVYDFAIRQCKAARACFLQDDVQGRTKALSKAQDALTELTCGLNMEAGGEVAKKLYALYDYMGRRLIEVNLKKEQAPLNEVVNLLSTLREAWVAAAETTRRARMAPSQAGQTGLSVMG